jgi:hypothetical protein
MKLQRSKSGFIVAAVFAGLALAALFLHLHSVKTNPGDSGESGIILLPFCSPWILMVPRSIVYSHLWAFLGYVSYILFVALNAFILYLLTGGVKWQKQGHR